MSGSLPWDQAAVERLASHLRLVGDPRRRRTGAGWQHARSAGSSLEFHDYRDYAPGDDPRRIDWRVFARSGQLLLRQHRAEIQQRCTIVLDCSASMALSPGKWRCALGTTALLATLAEQSGGTVRVVGADSDVPSNDGRQWRHWLPKARPTGRLGLAARALPVPPGDERLLVSDGLVAGGVAAARGWWHGAGSVCLLQVLTREERTPAAYGPVQLIDREAGSGTLIVDEAACVRYRQRLSRLNDAWRAALRGAGPGLISIDGDGDLDAVARTGVRSGLLVTGAAR